MRSSSGGPVKWRNVWMERTKPSHFHWFRRLPVGADGIERMCSATGRQTFGGNWKKKKKNCKADGNESRAHGVRTSNVQLTWPVIFSLLQAAPRRWQWRPIDWRFLKGNKRERKRRLAMKPISLVDKALISIRHGGQSSLICKSISRGCSYTVCC